MTFDDVKRDQLFSTKGGIVYAKINDGSAVPLFSPDGKLRIYNPMPFRPDNLVEEVFPLQYITKDAMREEALI